MKTKTGATVLLSSLALIVALLSPRLLQAVDATEAQDNNYQLVNPEAPTKECPESFENRESIFKHITKLTGHFKELNTAKDNGFGGGGTYYSVRRASTGLLDWVSDLALSRDRIILQFDIEDVYVGDPDFHSYKSYFCHYVYISPT